MIPILTWEQVRQMHWANVKYWADLYTKQPGCTESHTLFYDHVMYNTNAKKAILSLMGFVDLERFTQYVSVTS